MISLLSQTKVIGNSHFMQFGESLYRGGLSAKIFFLFDFSHTTFSRKIEFLCSSSKIKTWKI